MSKRKLFIFFFSLFIIIGFLPIVVLLVNSFWVDGKISLENYLSLLNPHSLKLFRNSFVIATSVSVFSTLLGGTFALFLTKTDLPFKTFLKITLLIPLFLPPYIVAVSWVDFLNLFNIDADLIYSIYTSIVVLIIIYTPIAFLIISTALQNISPGIEEAALIYTNYRTTFLKVIIPLLKPSIFSSFILIFILSLSEFSVPAFLSIQSITTEIFIQFSAFYNYNLALAQSSLIIIICVILLVIEYKQLADQPFLSISGRGFKNKQIQLKWKGLILIMVIGYFLLILFAPVTRMVFKSFSRGTEDLITAFGYLKMEMLHSLLYSFLGAVLIVVFGFSLAYFKGKDVKWSTLVLILSFALPSSVVGIALVNYYNSSFLNFIYTSPIIIVIAYLTRYLFIGERIAFNRLQQLPDSLQQAAAISGASTSSIIFRIVLPLMSEALFAAFIISFIFCLGELGTIIIAYPPGLSLVPIKIFTIMANAPQSITSSMCVVTLFFSFIVITLLFLLWNLLKVNKLKWI